MKTQSITLLCILFAYFTSCTDMDTDIIGEDVSKDTNLSTRSKGDGKYDVLGWGYDITKGYFDNSGVSQIAIVDIDSIIKSYPPPTHTGIVEGKPLEYTDMDIIAENAIQYAENLAANAKLSYGPSLPIASAFSGSLSAAWGQAQNYNSTYSIASFQKYYALKEVAIGLSPIEMQKHLTIQFKNDLKHLSDIAIIQKYGTHILTDIILGARVEIMYKAQSLSQNKTKSIEASLTATLKLFKFEAGLTYNESLASQNKDYNIKYKTIGGDPLKNRQGRITTDPRQAPSIDISEWLNSINESNYSFIDSRPGSLIPIYELVEDPIRKIQLESVVRRYIIDKQFSENSYISLTDESGLIEIIVSKREVFGQHNSISATIPDNYVLIGGGATVSNGDGLLMKSCPDSNLKRWYAQSKDLGYTSPHKLTVHAVGLKLKGISQEQLRQQMTIRSATSFMASHPQTSVSLPQEYTLIGGGAAINSNGENGSFLTKSIPNKNNWYAAGKDHLRIEPSSITAYAIGIKNPIPGFGELEISYDSVSHWIGQSSIKYTEDVGPEWLISCPGAETTFTTKVGRILTIIEPAYTNVTVGSKDHEKPDSGTLSLHLIKFRKKVDSH